MNLQDYTAFTRATRIYPKDVEVSYLVLGLCGEIGELCNSYKKVLRDDTTFEASKHEFLQEIGDCLWYYVSLCDVSEFSMEILNAGIGYTLTAADVGNNPIDVLDCLFALVTGNGMLLVNRTNAELVTIGVLLSKLIQCCGSTLEQVLDFNHDKLVSRQERNVLQGNGDNR